MREAVGDRIARRVPVAYAVQGGALPAGFAPPLGPHQALGHRPRHPRRRAAPGRPVRRDQRRRLLRGRQLPGARRAPAAAPGRPGPRVRDRRLPARHDAEPGRPGEPRRLHGERRGPPRLHPRGAEGRAGRRERAGARRVGRVAADPGRDARVAQLLGLHAGARAGARGRLPPVPGRQRRERLRPSTSCSRPSSRWWTRARRACASSAAAARGAGSPTPATGRASWSCSRRSPRGASTPGTSGRDGREAARPDVGRRDGGPRPLRRPRLDGPPRSRTRAASSTTPGSRLWRRSAGRRRYVLQQINRHVFHHPDEVMENMVRVTRHVAARLAREGVPDAARRVLSFAADARGRLAPRGRGGRDLAPRAVGRGHARDGAGGDRGRGPRDGPGLRPLPRPPPGPAGPAAPRDDPRASTTRRAGSSPSSGRSPPTAPRAPPSAAARSRPSSTGGRSRRPWPSPRRAARSPCAPPTTTRRSRTSSSTRRPARGSASWTSTR